MKKILKNVPGLVELDCSYTTICHISFNDPSIELHNLEKLDMSGCKNVTDLMIELMVKRIKKEGHSLKWLSLSGCELLTDKCLAYLKTVSSKLECVDFSG